MTLPAGTHKCAAIDCPAVIARHLLMCRSHWYKVPVEIRRAVWAGVRSGFTQQYDQAVGAAVAAVADKERK